MSRPEPMRKTLLGLGLAVLASCSKHATQSPVASGSVGPALIATQPPHFSVGAIYDSEIWGQFDRALDPRTVTALTAFLKQDGQRVPCTVSYEGITRRVVLRPSLALELQRTYTVEFTTAIKAFDETPLPPGVFFQFTTNSLRRIVYDYPAADALEGPVAALGWGGTQGPVNNLYYEVYASEDSMAVENRALPYLQRSVFTRLLPATAWPAGRKVYWAITSQNLETSERMVGPVHSFRVIDASAPLDSVSLNPRDHGSNDIRNRNTQFCSNQMLPCGPSYNGAIHWDYARIPANARVVSATMTLTTTDAYAGTFVRMRPVVWMAQNEWSSCTILAPGPPWNEPSGLLALGTQVDDLRANFTSDRLAAFVETQRRQRTLLYGVLVRTAENVAYHSPLSGNSSAIPRLVVRFHP